MVIIPQQLQYMRFVKVLRASKKPFEIDWQNKFYTAEELSQYLQNGGNYGVHCGYEYKENVRLAILDDDTPDKSLTSLFHLQISSFLFFSFTLLSPLSFLRLLLLAAVPIRASSLHINIL